MSETFCPGEQGQGGGGGIPGCPLLSVYSPVWYIIESILTICNPYVGCGKRALLLG